MAIRAAAAAAISTTTFCSTASIVFLILIFSLCVKEASSTSDCTSSASEIEYSYAITASKGLFTSRKILVGLMGRDNHNEQVAVNETAEFSSSSRGTSTRNIDADDELRNVPSGPDPLHHNGGSPKRPQAP